jgi:uncharacterized protein
MRHAPLAAAALALAAVAPITVPGAAMAHDHTQRPALEGTVLVLSADAEVTRAPDLATVSAGVQTDGKTAEAALAENARRMNGVMRALRAAGIAERDIQTSNISLNPQYQYVQDQPPRLIGYQAANTVTVRVRNIANLGRTLDSLVTEGGNQIQGISFSLDKPDAAMDEARAEAMRKARARADLYAQAAGLKVARIVSIQEGGAVPPPMPMPMAAMRLAADAGAAPTPVAAGEVGVSATVTVVFELK